VARRGGLGKGLGALIPPGTEIDAEPGGLEELPLSAISPNRYQPRDHFDEEALGALADSIREVGVLQPVLVRPVGEGYELVAGERRWRAARRVGLQTIPALVRETDDSEALEHALIENLHRDELNPLEEAAAYQQLIEDFGLTHDDVAGRVGKGRASVTNALRLLQLPPTIQRMVKERKLTMGHARALLGTPDRAFQERLAKQIAAEDLSVRATEEAVREHQGDDGGAQPDAPRSARKLRPPGLLELEELLGDYLETRVSISMGSTRGKVVVEFATLEDLERIYGLMTGPGAGADGAVRSATAPAGTSPSA
jgi:ParB family transcriptional regulator, chromosome partitioning protein